MDKERFNKYCADVMGYRLYCGHRLADTLWFDDEHAPDYQGIYNPYDDLNQMAEVVEKLLKNEDIFDLDIANISNGYITIKQAFRDFIISTMPEQEKE
jgi:hypothetical protein